jgi:hypothetical protein
VPGRRIGTTRRASRTATCTTTRPCGTSTRTIRTCTIGTCIDPCSTPPWPPLAIRRLRRSRGVVRVSRMAGGRIDPPVPPARDAPARSPPCGTDDHHVARSDGEPGRQTFWHGHQALLLVLLGADLATPRGCGQRRAVHGRALCAVSRRQQTAFFPELISTDISVRYCDG